MPAGHLSGTTYSSPSREPAVDGPAAAALAIDVVLTEHVMSCWEAGASSLRSTREPEDAQPPMTRLTDVHSGTSRRRVPVADPG